MASIDQDLIFGEFDDLSPEEHARVFQIIYGQKDGSTPKVEFPWDVESEELSGAVKGSRTQVHSWANQVLDYSSKTGAEFFDNQHHGNMEETDSNYFSFMDNPSNLEHFSGQDYEARQCMQNTTAHFGDIAQISNQDNQTGSQSKLQASLKQYERRNKKKRPPGYYSQPGDEQCTEHLGSFECNANELGRQGSPPGYTLDMDYQRVENQNLFQDQSEYCDYRMSRSLQNMSQPNYRDDTEVPQSEHNQNMHKVSGSNLEFVNANIQIPVHHLAYQSHVHHNIPQQRELGVDPSYVQSGFMCQNEEEQGNDLCEVVVESFHQANANIPVRSEQYKIHAHVWINNNAKIVSNSNQNEPSFQSSINIVNSIQDDSPESVDSVKNEFTVTPTVELSSQNKQSYEMQTDVHLEKPTAEIENENDSSELIQPGNKFSNEQAVPNAEITENAKKTPTSWAGLFKSATPVNQTPSVVKSVQASVQSVVDNSSVCEQKNANECSTQPVPATEDSAAKELGEHFSQMGISHASVILQPRGLVNKANWCYINGTLQALAACPPFYNLLKKLPRYPALQRGPSSTPILDAMIEFINEFQPMSRSIDKGQKCVKDITPGVPIEPTYVYKMLQMISVNPHFKLGRQEDAEEFLSCILDGMHEEMSAAVCMNNSIINTDGTQEGRTNGFTHGEREDVEEIQDDEDSWEQVGPKKKSVLTRRSKIAKTPIADIFSGMLRSAVYKSTAKETATLEPFFTLKLDIQSEKVESVQDALEGLVSKEQISGYSSSNTKTQVDLVKKLSLEELPPVLILHLKSFVYNQDGGSQKLIKKVDFSVDLEITKDLLSPNARNKLGQQQRSYKLFAVVYHHGKKSTGGHYTTAVFHPGINGWVHVDDSNVKTVQVSQVLRYMPPRVPYLLYYRRLDSH